MSNFGISQPVKRVEDARLVTGRGCYVDDVRLPGAAWGVMVRSPVAHARVRSLDVEAVRSAPGVIGVIVGADLEAADANGIPSMPPVRNRDGSPRADPQRPVLCTGRVRFAGDGLAFVVAETAAAARDAAERVEMDLDEIDAVVDPATADGEDRPRLHDDAPRNRYFDWEHGDAEAVAQAFAEAAHVTTLDLVNNRVVANSMEPRAAAAEWDEASGKLTVHASTQGGWRLRQHLAERVLGIPEERVRVLTPDVGGGFGMKVVVYPEQVLVAWAARALGRPVRWAADRGEGFLSDAHGRDHVTRAELAFDADHRIVAMRVLTRANLGAYLSTFGPFVPTGAAVKVLPGVYDVKRLHYRVLGVATNTVPVDAYRGAGRPESIYVIERTIDAAARELGVDPVELRRRNFIPADSMPFETAVGQVYDSGDFARVLDRALERADRAGFFARREESRGRGARRGLGVSYYVESTMGPPDEDAAIRFEDDDTVAIHVGTQSNGQGHETAYAQLVHQFLGVPFERVRVVQGDTDRIARGGGTGGSRSVTIQGWALRDAAEVVVERGRRLASLELEAAVEDIEFGDGEFRIVGTDRALELMELARRVRARDDLPEDLAGGLDGSASVHVDHWTFPNGCHVAEVEIDGETGAPRLVRYTVVDDFGTVINPLLLEGQVHGGIAQGAGQALLEHAVYDESGQLLTGSFLDYCMPRADDFPDFDFSTEPVPCANNPLGMKGAGEAGTVGAPAAVINAVVDALADLGVAHVDMPATPLKLWRILREG